MNWFIIYHMAFQEQEYYSLFFYINLQKIKLYCVQQSFYSGKIRAYLLQRNLPFEEILATGKIYKEIILKKVKVLNQLGVVLIKQKKYKQAISTLEQAKSIGKLISVEN